MTLYTRSGDENRSLLSLNLAHIETKKGLLMQGNGEGVMVELGINVDDQLFTSSHTRYNG